MSFYRTLLAAVAAVALVSPVFADDAANTAQNPSDAAPVAQIADNSSTAQSDAQAIASTDQQGATQEKLNLNKATAKELMKVKGLNATKAKAIVAYRKKHGDFKSLDEMNKVKGFKKVKPEAMKEIQDQLSVE